MTTDAKTDHDLFKAEEGLHQLYALAESRGHDTKRIEKAFDALRIEMSSRGLIADELTKAKGKRKKSVSEDRAPSEAQEGRERSDINDGNGPYVMKANPNHGSDGKFATGPGSGEKIPFSSIKHISHSDPDGGGDGWDPPDQNCKTCGKQVSENHDGYFYQDQTYHHQDQTYHHTSPSPGCAAGQAGVKKDSGPPPSYTHPADDPIRQKGKNKKGKGGESNRTQRGVGTNIRTGGDPKNPGDLGYITKKQLELEAIFTPEWFDDAFYKGGTTAHPFIPVRDVCKKCKQGQSAHGDGLDHAFDPVRNICKTCRNGSEVHKSLSYDPILKSIEDVTDDDFMEFFKELPQLSNDQRMRMGEQGIALPDGSFPIPDEAHLHAAIRLVGQAADPQSAMNHIIERANAMGMQDALPPAWNVSNDPNQGAAQVGPGASQMPGPGGPQKPQASATKPATGGAMAAGGAGAGSMPQATGGTSGVGPTLGGAQGAGPGPGGTNPSTPQSAAGGSGATASAPDRTKRKAATPLSGSGPSQPGLMKRLAHAFTKGGASVDVDLDDDFGYAVIKTAASAEERYTLGPVYMPGQLDAHGEWATAEDLQKSTWDFVKNSGDDRLVYLQHSDRPAGEWVEIMAWPHPVTAAMTKAVDGVQKSTPVEFPAGTVYMGVVWEPWAYDMVKSGKITGFSMGGYAQRVEGMPA